MDWAIATPVYKFFEPWYVESLHATMAADHLDRFGFWSRPEFLSCKYHYPHPARTKIINMALQMDLGGLLWIDSDMQWSPEDIKAVTIKAAELPNAVVGAFYPDRQDPAGVVGALLPDGTVDYFGFGFVWTPISVFSAFENWFYNEPAGEDVQFFRYCRKVGIELLRIDTEIAHDFTPGPRKLDNALFRNEYCVGFLHSITSCEHGNKPAYCPHGCN